MRDYQDFDPDALRARRHHLENHLLGLNDRAQSLLGTAETENRELTNEERTRIDNILAEAGATEEKIDAIEDELQAQTPRRKTTPARPGGSISNRASVLLDQPEPARSLPGRTPFAKLFPQAQDTHGFRSLQEFFASLHSGQHDNRLRHVAAAHVEGVGSDGGFLVPPGFLRQIFDGGMEEEVIRPRARVVPMASNTITIPALDDLDHSTGAPAGFAIAWTGEGETMTPQTGQLKQLTLRAKKAAIFSKATSELVSDAPLFEAQFLPALRRVFAWGLDRAFLNGTGVGQPLGILNAPSLITVPKETSQTADTIHFDNVRKMFARLHPASYRNAVWIINPSAISEILNLGKVVATASGTAAGGASDPAVLTQTAAGELRLFTLPVLVSEKMSALGDLGDILLVDLSRYIVGLRADITVARDASRYFDSDEVAYRLIARVDAIPAWDGVFTPDKGATLSWAVTLAARA